ncbi:MULTISPECIES: hypothetical protein [Wolbachia]|uniref:Uncharacterized protein n=1 Tax=Wolbachia pipientis TaxID=955 RepID=A0A7G5CBN5_WOLPI|nr:MULTISPECIES: hypothetical protein [Wolbachia]MDE5061506.1 hypothetical protein [Wolbachia endosymbiont of Drosophila nikananu]QMV46619.1 hypothetical protein HC356_00285 [Wolbachia pipientis]
MSNKIQFKKVTDYKVHEGELQGKDYKYYSIISKKNLDPNSNEKNYYVSIGPDVRGQQEEFNGLYSLHISHAPEGIDFMNIRHLNLVREPEYNEQSRTVNAELEFAQTSEPIQGFFHMYGESMRNPLMDISIDLT